MTPPNLTPPSGVSQVLDGLGEWDDFAELHMIATTELDLPVATAQDDSEANAVLKLWLTGRTKLPEAILVPLSSVGASIQGVLRLDVLEYYLTNPNGIFDDGASSWGADGPLAVKLSDGRVVVVDGNHRWAAAKLRGDESFKLQVLEKQP